MQRNGDLHPPATWPSTSLEPYQPAPVAPAAVELYGDREPVVYVPSATDPNVMVAVRRSDLPTPAMQPAPARDLTPQPLIDPRAQMMAAGGVFAAGAGWGVGQVLAPLAGISTGSLMWIAIAIAAWKVGGRKSGPTYIHDETHIHTEVTNDNRWFGRSNTPL